MGMMINRRRVCGGKSLPYDAEIEYLQSSGTQYIDTEICISPNLRFELEAYFDNSARGSSLLGAAYIDSNNYINNIYIIFGNNHFSIQANYSRTTALSNITSDTLTLGYWYSIEFEFNKLWVNKKLYTGNYSLPQESNAPILLFGRINQRNEFLSSKVKIKYTKIIKNNVLVRDLIPVRIGQIGYLYDKVSGQLFGNAGTGAFILGPDK